MKNLSKFFIVSVLCAQGLHLDAQVELLHRHAFDGARFGLAADLQSDANGYFLAGQWNDPKSKTQQATLFRADKNGHELWSKKYPSSLKNNEFTYIALGKNGTLWASGTSSGGKGNNYKLGNELFKINPQTGEITARVLQVAKDTSFSISGLVALPDGAVLVGCDFWIEKSKSLDSDGFVGFLKYDSNGKLIKKMMLPRQQVEQKIQEENLMAVALDPDGNAVLLVEIITRSSGGSFGGGYRIVRIDSEANVLESKLLDAKRSRWGLEKMAIHPVSGDILLSGDNPKTETYQINYMLLDKNLNVKHSKTYPDAQPEQALYDACFAADGNILVAGIRVILSDDEGKSDNQDVWVAKINAIDGTTVWEYTEGGEYKDQALKLAILSSGNIGVLVHLAEKDRQDVNSVVLELREKQ